MLVDDGRTHQGRRVTLAPVLHGETAGRLDQKILTGSLLVWPPRFVARERAVNDTWVCLRDGFVAETQTLHRARLEVLYNHVGLGEHAPDDLLALLGAQIDAQAPLVAARQQEEDALPVQVRLGSRPVALVATAGRLYLDDVRPEVSEDLGRRWSLQIVREAEYLDPFEHGPTRSSLRLRAPLRSAAPVSPGRAL